MSMLACQECAMWLDTDECPETYRETLDKWLCDACYEGLDENDDAALKAANGGGE